jgi:hypothetical protein
MRIATPYRADNGNSQGSSDELQADEKASQVDVSVRPVVGIPRLISRWDRFNLKMLAALCEDSARISVGQFERSNGNRPNIRHRRVDQDSPRRGNREIR